MSFQKNKDTISDEMISREVVQPDPKKLHMLMSPWNKELQSILGVMSYLGMFSPSTVQVCDELRKLTSLKCDWT